MGIRSTHGPFTCRLGSGQIDIRLSEEGRKHSGGVCLTYKKALKEHQPEFVRTYFQWLLKEKGLTIDDPVQIGIFAHASNGGIQIDREGSCKVPGLYACGEVLDIDGDCGGYNLQWAWSSGYLAGRCAL